MDDNYLEELRYRLDSQEQPAILTCDRCGCEIYEGEEYYKEDEFSFCEDCFDINQDIYKKECREIARGDEEIEY